MSVSLFHDNFYAMGTRFEVLFWGVSTSFARPVYNQIHDEVQQLEADLSHYDAESPISAINRNAGVKPVAVPGRVLSTLRRCQSHREGTQGLFDVVDQSGAGEAERNTISAEASVLDLSEEEGTVFLREKTATIDLGGIGKGIALERVDNILDRYEVDQAVISFGESSILTRGHHPHGTVWKLGVSHMTRPETSLCSFDLTNQVLSTSGNTPRNEGHLRQPRTGRPKEGYETVSVCTESPVDAEVLSTALLLANQDEVREILETYAPSRAVRITYDHRGANPNITELRQPTLS